jgi:hypothetical protein
MRYESRKKSLSLLCNELTEKEKVPPGQIL